MFERFDGYDHQPGYVFGRRVVSGLVDVHRSRVDVALMCVSDEYCSPINVWGW